MGLFDFGDSKPRVTKQEFHQKVRQSLYGNGFSHKELDQLEGYFGGDMHESGASHSGIDAKEVDRGVTWLREHKNDHTFSPKQIDDIETEFKKHL
ncbi:MAG: hypothetical protein A3C06_02630 [Candidatus Taylorbacteria bacterium RIFCSPHIGHO2_02_FULL_46_13]|uniref:Uncharacterized protein n=1 Tax=Candidatus Taylorbacteria bacterium RIFCSPHIGHO2_02_FULL_46_13 TaxID=1802312 RepID=A0A1G2MRD0_9BACT|nr:MAG: hypothetical protein A3C06_02630 [Candidatus Taylorbacteria bacterium RIFCSPHIGHO2_02_FULL_46_13]